MQQYQRRDANLDWESGQQMSGWENGFFMKTWMRVLAM